MNSNTRSALVSIIIPAFNAAETISESILSATNQSYGTIEVIIVNDGSTDRTAEICKFHAGQDSRIKYFYQENSGVSAARNTGIRMAEGDFIAFLDADDIWEKNKIELQVSVGRNTESVVLSEFQRFSDDGVSRKLLLKTTPPQFNGSKNYLRTVLSLANNEMASFATALVPRKSLEAVGLFDQKLESSEDWDLWLRLASQCPFANIEQTLMFYRKHPSSLTKRTKLQNTLNGQIYIINKIARNGVLSPAEIRAAKTRKYIEFAGSFWGKGMWGAAIRSAIQAVISCPGECSLLLTKIYSKMTRPYSSTHG